MARDLNEFERIAVAITAAMRNDIEPLKALLADLRAAGHTDYTIGEMFMSVGAIVFDEGDVITEEEEDMKRNSGELIAEAVAKEQKRIIDLLISLNAIRYDAFGNLVAMNTHGTEVVYLDDLERESK